MESTAATSRHQDQHTASAARPAAQPEPNIMIAGRHSGGMIGTSPKMLELNAEIARAAHSNHSVLINGESGTGKTTAAGRIHEQSARSGRPFVDINCANFQETLLESELFGHEKGSFSGAAATKKGLFEVAEGGTLFLDEIAEMRVELQAKLLKAIEQKKIRRLGGTQDIRCDVRIIAATSRNIPEMIKGGTFREDLYYRLAVFEVHTTPLREKREDVPALIRRCLVEEQKMAGRKTPFRIEEAAVRELTGYDWPGNIRQLQNIVARLAARVEGDAAITLEGVRATLSGQANAPKQTGATPAFAKGADGSVLLPEDVRTLRAGESLQDFIDRVILVTIETTRQTEGNVTRAALRLDCNRTSLLQRLGRVKHRQDNDRAAPEGGGAIAA